MSRTLWDDLQEPIVSKLHGVVLDAGCGNGDYSRQLVDVSTIDDVWSLDSNPGHPHFSYGQNIWENISRDRFILADVRDMSSIADKTFDCTVAWHLMEYVPRASEALRELIRITKDLIAFSLTRTAFTHWDPIARVLWWSVEEFEEELLKNGLTPIQPVYIDCSGDQNWLCRVPGVVK